MSTEERLKKIEEKLERIDGKMSDKWVLPVSLAILTAAMGLLTFFVQRQYSRSDIRGNKMQEKIGELSGTKKVEFSDSCAIWMTSIDRKFEEYCLFDHDDTIKEVLVTGMKMLNSYVDARKQAYPLASNAVQAYLDTVANSLFDMNAVQQSAGDMAKHYKQSNELYKHTLEVLNDGLK